MTFGDMAWLVAILFGTVVPVALEAFGTRKRLAALEARADQAVRMLEVLVADAERARQAGLPGGPYRAAQLKLLAPTEYSERSEHGEQLRIALGRGCARCGSDESRPAGQRFCSQCLRGRWLPPEPRHVGSDGHAMPTCVDCGAQHALCPGRAP
jgi:hypothetical protein